MNDFPHFQCPICLALATPVLSFATCMHKVCKACGIRLGWNENSTRVMTCPTCLQISWLRVDHAVTQTIEDFLQTTSTPDAAPDAQRGDAASTIVTPPVATQPSSVDLLALHRLISVMKNQADRFELEANRYEVVMRGLEVEVTRGLLQYHVSAKEFFQLVGETLRSRAEGEAPLDFADLGAMASHLSRYCGRAADEICAVRDAINTGINAMRMEREEHRPQRDLEQAQRAAARGRLLAARREAADRGDAPSTDAHPQ